MRATTWKRTFLPAVVRTENMRFVPAETLRPFRYKVTWAPFGASIRTRNCFPTRFTERTATRLVVGVAKTGAPTTGAVGEDGAPTTGAGGGGSSAP